MKKFIVFALMCILSFATTNIRASDTSPGAYPQKFTIEKIVFEVPPVILHVSFEAPALSVSNEIEVIIPTPIGAAASHSADAYFESTAYRDEKNLAYRSKNFQIKNLIPYARDRS